MPIRVYIIYLSKTRTVGSLAKDFVYNYYIPMENKLSENAKYTNEIISSNRSFLMGIAILWVVLYHIPEECTLPVIGFIKNAGYGGVDIFIFLSGFGSFYSLKKNEDALSFLKRRLIRLFPSYLLFITIFMIVQKVTSKLYFTEICGNLTMTGWWAGTPDQFNWYIDCIILFYILAPYIFGVIKRGTGKILATTLMILFAFLISIGFMHSQQLIAMVRLPIFILGFAFAGVECKLTEKRFAIIFWNIVGVIGWGLLVFFMNQATIDNWHYGTYWYPFFLIVPGLVIDLSLLGSILESNVITSKIKSFFMIMGTASFEIYLWHILIFEKILPGVSLPMNTGVLGSLLSVIVSLIIGYAYFKLISFLKSNMNFKKKEI